LAKKQKKATPERVPTKHQLSKWQRQMRIRRIVIIAAVVFLAGISSWVGYGYYKDYKASVGPLREVVIEVNGVNFTMEYFIKLFDSYTAGMNSTIISYYGNYIANTVADNIINAALLRQGAESLNITVTTAEIDAMLEEYELPNDSVYRDMVRASLLQEKLTEEYFGPQLPNTMEQAHVQAMLVESQEVATELIAEIKAGGNFTALAEEFSCNSSIKGDLGWLPEELMPNTLIANAAFNLTPGKLSQPIYDESATKEVGYWLIEVTDKQDDEIKARAMLLGSEAEAEQVKAELVSGNFSSLAKEYSQHESKTAGGELGWLKQGDMGSNAFDQVAFNITVNEVSEPVKDESVQTTGGYWLVKVIDRGDHGLEEKAKEGLIANHFNDWFEEWTRESTIETHLDAAKISWAVNKVLEGR
jgi:parvulin-like peptidyl-prolyl isomerase